MTPVFAGPDAVILTEAGERRGLGHLGRCLGLADALEACGARPRLFVRGIDAVPEVLTGGLVVDAAEWIEELPPALAGCGIAIVDSYDAPADVYAAVADATRVGVWLDDTRRLVYPPGLMVDGGVAAANKGLRRVPPGTVLLFGPQFQPLRRPFWTIEPRPASTDVSRMIVVMGGTDVRGLGARVTTALAAELPAVELDLVRGDRGAAGMLEAILAADLGVTAAGQILFELAAAGVPAVGIVAEDNQRSNAEGWADAGFLHLAGDWDTPDLERRVVEAVRAASPYGARELAGHSGRTLCDGRGALRVAERAVSAWRASTLMVRRAVAGDKAALLTISNDPQVRAASFKSKPITAEEHHAWFEERLKDADSLLFVVEDADGVAGLVRSTVHGTSARIGIALAPRIRGKGLAAPLIERGLAGILVARPEVTRAVALVRAENRASRALFSAASFTEEEPIEQQEAHSVCFVRNL